MGRTVKDIDGKTLEEAQKLLGTSNTKETVNAALREVVRLKIIDEFISDMRQRDIEELDKAREEAWR